MELICQFFKSFCHTWQNDFDWRKHENKINETGSFRFTSNSGLKIHFLHSKSNTSNSLPIVMTHGWPGSVQEFLKIIPMLHKAAQYRLILSAQFLDLAFQTSRPNWNEFKRNCKNSTRASSSFRIQTICCSRR